MQIKVQYYAILREQAGRSEETVATAARTPLDLYTELQGRHPKVIEEIRGEGLMQGLKLRVPNTDFAAAARAEKIIVIPAGENVVRIVPPLVISEDELKEGVRRLEAACRHFKNAPGPLGTQGAKA